MFCKPSPCIWKLCHVPGFIILSRRLKKTVNLNVVSPLVNLNERLVYPLNLACFSAVSLGNVRVLHKRRWEGAGRDINHCEKRI